MGNTGFVIRNTRDYDITNGIITVHAQFEKGERFRLDALMDEAGRSLPCQWEPCRSAAFQWEKDLGSYEDGSLRTGNIVFQDTLGMRQERRYFLTGRTDPAGEDKKGCEAAGDSAADAGNVLHTEAADFYLDEKTKLLQYVSVSGEKNPVKHVLSVIDASGKEIKISEEADEFALQNSGITASGAVFQELENVYCWKGDWSVTVRYRVYCSGRLECRCYFQALRELEAGAYRGVFSRFEDLEVTRRAYSEETHLSTNVTWNAYQRTCCAGVLFTHGDRPRTDPSRPEYPAFSQLFHTGSGQCGLKAGWQYDREAVEAGKPVRLFEIPEQEVFASGIYLDFSAEYCRLPLEKVSAVQCPLTGRLVTETREELKEKLMKELETILLRAGGDFYRRYHGENNSDGGLLFTVAPSSQLFLALHEKEAGRCDGEERITLENTLQDIYRMCEGYFALEGGEAMYQAFREGKLVYQLMSRLFPAVRTALHVCRKLLRTGDCVWLEKSLRSYAEMTCRIVEDRGFTPLWYALPDYNSNAVGAGMRALAMGLELDPGNTRWQAAFWKNKAHFKAFLRYHDCIATDDMDSNVSSGQYLHYALFALNEYTHAMDHIGAHPDVETSAYGWFAFNAAGQAREQEYCISSSRRGLPHTYAYQIAMLVKENTAESIGEALAIAGNLREQITEEGRHVFPLEGWRYEPSQTYEGAVPFELNLLAEILLKG